MIPKLHTIDRTTVGQDEKKHESEKNTGYVLEFEQGNPYFAST